MFIYQLPTNRAHPVNVDNCVIDWTFTIDWFTSAEKRYRLKVQKPGGNILGVLRAAFWQSPVY